MADRSRLPSLPTTIVSTQPSTTSKELDALWHLDPGRTLFIGPLDYNASHQHGAPVYLTGL
jgi:hypothetical protein